ncbi:TPA_asm: maturation protein [ssRNA phage SRR6960799_12]|uniref:Maturation protein n=1 Tax=ssRNA phage SRR6960799_12 TaxID=2786568 RepID=A0A8S5L4N1_9VIRU|nr:maturation protein [ssRNA phage SRR6960799_12]DAD52293.1 TPA_asm: maturation protein [ssRNA phage SRR6960799_12]
MPRSASAGQTVVPKQWCDYYKAGELMFHELQPTGLGYFTSQFERAAAVNNPMNKNGWRKPSVYYGTLAKYEEKWYRWSYTSSTTLSCSNSYQTPIPMLMGLSSFPALCSNDLSRARNKALLELKDQTVNLSLAFKERQQTVDLITDAAKNVYRSFKSIKQILRSPRRLRALHTRLKGKWKDSPESWLLYRYGIVPTMLDVYGASEALEKRDNGTYDRYMVTVRGKSTTVLRPKLLSRTVGAYGRYYPVLNTVVDRWQLAGKYGARVRYDAALTNSSYLRLSEVGVTNPVEVVWEMLTLSFVADWFLSIGDWCAALDATVPFTFIGGSETTFVDWSGETRVINPVISKRSDSGPSRYKRFMRTAVSSFPSANPFVLKQNPINLTRLADALALLASFAKSKALPSGRL